MNLYVSKKELKASLEKHLNKLQAEKPELEVALKAEVDLAKAEFVKLRGPIEQFIQYNGGYMGLSTETVRPSNETMLAIATSRVNKLKRDITTTCSLISSLRYHSTEHISIPHTDPYFTILSENK